MSAATVKARRRAHDEIPLTDSDAAAALVMWREGLSLGEIALRLGVRKPRVFAALCGHTPRG